MSYPLPVFDSSNGDIYCGQWGDLFDRFHGHKEHFVNFIIRDGKLLIYGGSKTQEEAFMFTDKPIANVNSDEEIAFAIWDFSRNKAPMDDRAREIDVFIEQCRQNLNKVQLEQSLSANEIYASNFTRIYANKDKWDNPLRELRSKNFGDISQLLDNAKEDTSILGFVVKEHFYSNGDGNRTVTLSSLWLDDKPFCLFHESGRGGDEYTERFITDKALWFEFVQRLILIQDENELCDFVDSDKKIIREVYNHTIKNELKWD